MPTTIEFPLFAQMSRRLDRSRHDRSGASADRAMLLTLWAIVMLWIGAGVHLGAPSAADSAIQLIGML